ncbi:hypothetical protein KP509_1Z103200 [Ceratopteris richardii]|nr:hypothetical protein KP509_1Z103200 [Ceratopteris richardii]
MNNSRLQICAQDLDRDEGLNIKDEALVMNMNMLRSRLRRKSRLRSDLVGIHSQ